MNRRDFTKSLAALGLAPALPALPATAAAPAYTPYMYGLGAHLARSAGQCSPGMLVQKLRLTPQAAQAMHTQLIRSGVLSRQAATGLAQATQPYMRGAITRAAHGSALAKTAKDIARVTAKSDLNSDPACPEVRPNSRDPHPSSQSSET